MGAETFPNLFTEATDALVVCIFVFAFADLRGLARNGDLEAGADEVLHLPLPSAELRSILIKNKEVLKGKLRSNEYDTLEDIMQKYAPTKGDWIEGGQVLYFADENASEECVYGIGTNSTLETITVSFRGSITVQDWLKDAKMVLGEIPNPVDQSDVPFLGVHQGFLDYLYGTEPSLVKKFQKISTGFNSEVEDSTKNNKKSKLETIMELVGDLLEQNPGYRLCFTGHSLGAALAVLASLEAAARFGTRERPVTCVAVANPRVGDTRYQHAFQTLEQQGRLRCLLVQNDLDLVPLQPSGLLSCGITRPRAFCQQGMQVLLSTRDFNTHYYGRKNDSVFEYLYRQGRQTAVLLMCWMRMGAHHNYREYLQRLLAQKEALSNLTLNELYKKEDIDF